MLVYEKMRGVIQALQQIYVFKTVNEVTKDVIEKCLRKVCVCMCGLRKNVEKTTTRLAEIQRCETLWAV